MIIKRFGLSIRRACGLVELWRSSYTRKIRQKSDEETVLRKEMIETAQSNTRWGCPMVHMVLRNKGLVKNHKRTERIYKEEDLSVRRKRRREKIKISRVSPDKPTYPNEHWAMDFVHDSLWTGKKIRILTMVDIYSKKCPVLEIDTSIGGYRLTKILDQLKFTRGLPKRITIDNGPEFRSKIFVKWAYDNHITLDYIRPGKPVDNCHIESFNGRLRDECLNEQYFSSVYEAKIIIENWRKKYNGFRPQKGLSGLTPEAFQKQYYKTNKKPGTLHLEVV
jgi:putative transposase